MNTKIRNIIGSIGLITLLCTMGCSTLSKPSIPKTIKIQMTHSGKCQIENQIVPISKINKTIKSLGGKKDSRIAIIVPKDMGFSEAKKVLLELSEGGYRKVHLQNPRKAISYVSKNKEKERGFSNYGYNSQR